MLGQINPLTQDSKPSVERLGNLLETVQAMQGSSQAAQQQTLELQRASIDATLELAKSQLALAGAIGELVDVIAGMKAPWTRPSTLTLEDLAK